MSFIDFVVGWYDLARTGDISIHFVVYVYIWMISVLTITVKPVPAVTSKEKPPAYNSHINLTQSISLFKCSSITATSWLSQRPGFSTQIA